MVCNFLNMFDCMICLFKINTNSDAWISVWDIDCCFEGM